MQQTNHQQAATRSQAHPASNGIPDERPRSSKAKGPHEALEALAPGRMGWALVQSTVGCLLLMAALTVVPYLMSKPSTPTPGGDAKPTEKAQEQKPSTPDTPTAVTKTPGKTGTGTNTTTNTADNK